MVVRAAALTADNFFQTVVRAPACWVSQGLLVVMNKIRGMDNLQSLAENANPCHYEGPQQVNAKPALLLDCTLKAMHCCCMRMQNASQEDL